MKNPPATGHHELDAAQHRAGPDFVESGVRPLADDDLVAGPRLARDGELIAHRARRHEERGFLAGQRRHLLLEGTNGRVLAEDVVANLRLGHGAAHAERGAGDRVAAKIDQRGDGRGHRGSVLGWDDSIVQGPFNEAADLRGHRNPDRWTTYHSPRHEMRELTSIEAAPRSLS